MPEKLRDFGYLFQIKLLVILLTDKNFLEQIYDILEEDFFDSKANKWLIKQIKSYYEKYKSQITFNAIKVELSSLSKEDEVLKTTIIEHIRDINKNFNATDLEYVKEKTLVFCKNQKLKSAIIQSIDLLKSEKYNDIKALIDEASIAGEERNLGHDYINNFEDRYNETLRKCIKTNWNVVDDLTIGGLGAGELGVMIGGSGSGKSWFLAAIGAAALGQGKKVIHYTLELNSEYTGLRYDSIFTGVNFKDLRYHKKDVLNTVEEYKDSLLIKQYPATIASVNTLRAHIKRAEALNFKPDLIIIDYADLLTTNLSKQMMNSYHIGGRLYEELRGLSVEVGVPIWTASQSHRAAAEEDIIEGHDIADSYKKVMTADFIMSISRKVEDKIANTARIHIVKNRFGSDGKTFTCKFNANNGHIEIFDHGTKGHGEEQKKQNNHSEYMRKTLARRYKNLGKGKEKKKKNE